MNGASHVKMLQCLAPVTKILYQKAEKQFMSIHFKMKKTLTALLLLVIFIFSDCTQSNSIPERVGSTLDSKVTGTVTLYNDLQSKVKAYGMTVSIEGTSYTATTDSGGKYIFKDVKYGTYSFIFSKPGYGTSRIDTFKHVNNNDQIPSIVPNKTMGAISSTSITALAAEVDGDTIIIHPSTSPAATRDTARGVRFFYGTSASVSGSNYSGYSPVYGLKTGIGSVRVGKEDLYKLGFTPGSTVYVKAYGDSFFSSDYLDLNTGKRVFPNLNSITVDAVPVLLP